MRRTTTGGTTPSRRSACVAATATTAPCAALGVWARPTWPRGRTGTSAARLLVKVPLNGGSGGFTPQRAMEETFLGMCPRSVGAFPRPCGGLPAWRQLQQRLQVRRSVSEREQRGREGELEHRRLAILSFQLGRLRPQCGHIRVCNNTHGRKSVHPQRGLKINLTRGTASKWTSTQRRGGDKKGTHS